ncbi:MAG TPA: hypothetical protein VF584_18655 [Longimicrobium sp.]|jgi:hypothetical protein
MRTLLIALALACAPLSLSAQQGQSRVPERAAREAAEIQARLPAKGTQPAMRAGRDAPILDVARKPQKARPAPAN